MAAGVLPATDFPARQTRINLKQPPAAFMAPSWAAAVLPPPPLPLHPTPRMQLVCRPAPLQAGCGLGSTTHPPICPHHGLPSRPATCQPDGGSLPLGLLLPSPSPPPHPTHPTNAIGPPINCPAGQPRANLTVDREHPAGDYHPPENLTVLQQVVGCTRAPVHAPMDASIDAPMHPWIHPPMHPC